MKSICGIVVTSALVVLFLSIPAGLSAKEKRGANLIVTRLDGSQVIGELIAVKRDSLLLLSYGRDESIDLADVKTVRIVRRSRSGQGAMLGFVGGVLTGAILGGTSGGIDEFTASEAGLIFGFVFGIVGGLGGLGVGTLMSIDTTIDIAGEPEALVQSRLEKLKAFSREYRLGGGRMQLKIGPSPAPRAPVPAPGVAEMAPSRPRRSLRFRVRLPYTVAISPGYHYDYSDRAQTTFRFLDALPEPGPYPTELVRHPYNGNRSGLDSASLGYELSERLAAEVELVFARWSAGGSEIGALRYASAIDGKTYEQHFVYYSYTARFSAALLGLTYRPSAPSEFRRHIVEAGLAVGPAWTGRTASEFYLPTAPLGRKITLSARVHAAYDFYVIPSLSFGVAVGYRYFRVDLPASTETATIIFWDAAEEYPSTFVERVTEMTIPPRKIDASGFYIGLRLGVRI
ncbi:MAG: hypothetical protein MUQ25_20345 [Candidatus Aminicenantes bacterium]|nr:hypothetical protein [Candidatus Aminicenantes bacterium]